MMKKSATNSTNMKYENRKLILNLIRKKPISRADIARQTGLTRAAVSLIINDLIEKDIIIERGIVDSNNRRKPIYLGINTTCLYVIGVDITSKHCLVGVVSITGELIAQSEIDFTSLKNAYNGIDIIVKKVQEIIKANVDPKKVLGIGISAPGPLDIYKGKILNPPNLKKWHDMNIVQELQKRLGYKIYLDNNAIALTLFEKNYGLGKTINSFLELLVDKAGIGAGIVINERLYRGVMGLGSEIGHTTIDINGRLCTCGNRGCLECYTAISAVLSETQEQYPEISSWEEIVDRAETQPSFLDIVKKEANYLSAGIANCMNLLELEAVVLTGDITYKPDLLINEIKKHLKTRSITSSFKDINIYTSKNYKDMQTISAATIVLDKFFNEDLMQK